MTGKISYSNCWDLIIIDLGDAPGGKLQLPYFKPRTDGVPPNAQQAAANRPQAGRRNGGAKGGRKPAVLFDSDLGIDLFGKF